MKIYTKVGFFLTLIPALLYSHLIMGQEKRALSHSDYDHWQSLSEIKMAENGEWAGYKVNLQDGDGRAIIVSTKKESISHSIPRGESLNFSADGNWVIGLVSTPKDTIENLKLNKVSKDNFPKDSLYLLELNTGKISKKSGLKTLKVPEKNKTWYGAMYAENGVEEDSTNADSLAKVDNGNGETYFLELTQFEDQKTIVLEKVSDFGFDEQGKHIYFIQSEKDSSGLKIMDLDTEREFLVADTLNQHKHISFSHDGDLLVFLGSGDTKDKEKPYFQLYTFDRDNGSRIVAEKGDFANFGLAKVSESYAPQFSKDDQRLFFGIQTDYVEYEYENDTTILDEDRVKLDIWGWQDDEIQPMQLNRLNDRLKQSFLAVHHFSDAQTVALGDAQIENVMLNKEKTSNMALGVDDTPYRRNYSWDIQIGKDLYAIDIQTGNRVQFGENVMGNPRISPAGKFAYWYQNSDSSWMAYNFQTMETINLVKNIESNFYNELHDSPSLPQSYGFAGWTENDASFLVYDRNDIWKIDPMGYLDPVNLTQGYGKANNMELRVEVLDDEVEYLNTQGRLVLRGMDMVSKSSGYFEGDWNGKVKPQELVFGPLQYSGLKKAQDAETYIYQKSTYQRSPDVYLTGEDFNSEVQLSAINPQQQEILWGDVELVSFRGNDGELMDGLLFKPEGFDPEKKYPMMVYFYERRSDGLHQYRSPVPSASVINIPFFVSNGYLVFVPDIKYEIGLPGPSAYNCVVPGVQEMIAKGFVDPDNIGIQGQSWGGYQAAYIITRTDLFKAAGTGAPVANMTSAYGGIRWGTGMSRMFQYEQTQSRIGGTLWEKPMHYIENSPLFYADRINTPTLIMHNDADGAVPWYQGIEFFMALKRNNVPSWLLVYNGEDHNLRERKNRKDLSIRLSQFFDHYLKEAPAPLWMTEGLPATEKGRTLKYELSE